MAKSLVEMCAEIVAAQAGHTRLTPEEIGDSLRQVFRTLQDVQRTGQSVEVEESVARDPQSSIQRNQVLCLECGKSFKLLSNRLEEIVNSDASAPEKIKLAIANHVTIFHRHYPHIAVYLHDFHNVMQKLQDNSIETPKEYQLLLAQLVQQGVDSGELRTDLDATVAGYAILGMCNWMYRWYKPEGHMSAEAIAEVFTKLILEGLQQPV